MIFVHVKGSVLWFNNSVLWFNNLEIGLVADPGFVRRWLPTPNNLRLWLFSPKNAWNWRKNGQRCPLPTDLPMRIHIEQVIVLMIAQYICWPGGTWVCASPANQPVFVLWGFWGNRHKIGWRAPTNYPGSATVCIVKAPFTVSSNDWFGVSPPMLASYLIDWGCNPFLKHIIWFIKTSKQVRVMLLATFLKHFRNRNPSDV